MPNTLVGVDRALEITEELRIALRREMEEAERLMIRRYNELFYGPSVKKSKHNQVARRVALGIK